ncbi:hypothetical protein [Sphingomonas sp. KC8]|uniref:hypothetical protein n=1 Tax=Sphingomonas sp. KC8 TaxID=1030157 RepID=UPI0011101274|nr:hypothetical protein [Sphingomonas sp. KC8]
MAHAAMAKARPLKRIFCDPPIDLGLLFSNCANNLQPMVQLEMMTRSLATVQTDRRRMTRART